MNVNLTRRCLSMLTVLVMLFTMMPTTVLAEEVHDHDHETTDSGVSVITVEALSVSASASANHVYAGEGTVTVTAKISGGMAPYEVTLQAVKDGSVLFTDTTTTESSSVKLNYTPASYGDYELVVTVHDALHTQDLTSVSLAVAERDAETEAEWAASVSGASVSSNWAKSLLSVAKTQVGYAESEKDFIVKSGEKQGYSRYGAWYGTPYAGWNVAFLAFAAEYAKIPNDALLSGSSYRSWVNGFSRKGAYMTSDYTPKAGDIAFLSGSRVAIVESVGGSNVTVIEGDVNGTVARKNYAISKVVGFGNSELMQGLYNGTATAVPTAAPEATKAPETGSDAEATAAPTATPVATPVPEEEELVFQATPTPGPGVTVAPKDDSDPLQNVSDAMDDLVSELDAAATAIPAEFSEAYYLMQAEIHKLMEKYFGTANPTKAEIEAFVEGLEMADLYYVWMELEDLEAYATNICFSVYEGGALDETETAAAAFVAEVTDRWTAMADNRAASGTHTPIEGVTVTVSGATDNSMSNGTVTVTAKGNGGLFGLGASSKTATITITNTSETTAKILFDWIATNVNQLKIDNTLQSGENNTYEKEVEAGSSITITITTGKNNTENKLTLKSFTLVAVASSADITFAYDDSLGYITVDGNRVNNGDTVNVGGTELVANPNEDVHFYGWVDSDGALLSADISYTYSPKYPATVYAVFGHTTPAVWKVDDQTFAELNAAAMYAVGSQSKVAVLMQDYTLPAGDYTIPKGATLLIPFDDANTLYTSAPANDSASDSNPKWQQPSAYRTLTMDNGAKIVVDGAMSLSAKHHAGATGNSYAGSPTGTASFVRMEGSSNITVNSGATLYAWGYITGSGTVTAKSGANVYEYFQFMDFRGGTATSSMALKTWEKMFPLSQYYVQNIEVPLTIEAGATEYGYTSIYMNSEPYSSAVPFIGGTNNMFKLVSGSVTKWYDGKSDRLKIRANGDMSVSPVSVGIGNINMNSDNFVLCINSNISLEVMKGSNITITQDVLMQPGSEIIVNEEATCTLSTGASFYIIDSDEWGGFCGSGNATFIPLGYAPGRTYTRTAKDLVDVHILMNGTLEGSAGYVYTSTGGASIVSSDAGVVKVKKGSATTVNQPTQSGTSVNPTKISINPAWLKNGEGVDPAYTETGNPDFWTLEITDLGVSPSAVDGTAEWTYVYSQSLNRWMLQCDTSATDETQHVHYYWKRYENIEPDCLNGGGDVYVCSCTDAEPVYSKRALGHDYAKVEDKSKDPTCEEAGYYLFVCSRCQDEVTVDVNSKFADLDASIQKVLDPDSTGYDPATALKATGHNYTKTEDGEPVACEKNGTIVFKCDNGCNTFVTVEYHADSAAYIKTLHETIQTAITTTDIDNLKAKEHSFVNYIVDTPSTCTVKGTETAECAHGCGKTDTRELELADHAEVKVAGYAPTCTKPGLLDGAKCEVCGETIKERTPIPANGHSYVNNNVETEPASCTAPGYILFTCEECNKEDGYQFKVTEDMTFEDLDPNIQNWLKNNGITTLESLEQQPHSYGTPVLTERTCLEDGYLTLTCTKCGAKNEATEENEGIVIIRHNTIETELNQQAWSVYEAYLSINTGFILGDLQHIGHQEVVDEAVAATCIATGKTEGKHCSACGTVMEAQETIDALPHNYTVVKATERTCTVDGTLKASCDQGCKYDQTFTPAEFNAEGGVADMPDDVKELVTEALLNQVTALGHTAGNPVTENEVAATCTTAGSYDTVEYCSVCSTEEKPVEISRETTTVSARGHAYTQQGEAVDPTCTKHGEITFVCGNAGCDAATVTVTYPNDGDCEKLFNSLDEDIREVLKDADAIESLKMTDHKYVQTASTPVSCGVTGVIVYTCDNDATCPEIKVTYIDDSTDYDKLYESYHATIKADLGSADAIRALKAWVHEYGAVPTKATCESAAFVTYTCPKCNHSYVETSGEPLGHTYVANTTPSNSCTTNGTVTVSCTTKDGCGWSVTFDPADFESVVWPNEDAKSKVTQEMLEETKGDHEFRDDHYEPETCTESGYFLFGCEKCDAVVRVTYHEDAEAYYETLHSTIQEQIDCEIITALAPTGHRYEEDLTKAIAATCTEVGKRVFVCQNSCGGTVEVEYGKIVYAELDETIKALMDEDAYELLNATGHDYGYVYTAPICEVDGKIVFTCGNPEGESTCGEKVEITKETTAAELEALCENEQIETAVNAEFPEGLTPETDLEALEHQWNDGEVTTAPTCTETGEKMFTCTRAKGEGFCGATYTEEVAATGHKYEKDDSQTEPATCTESGKLVFKCGNDGCTVSVPVEYTENGYANLEAEIQKVLTSDEYDALKPTDHNYQKGEGKPATCTANGAVEFECGNDSCDETLTVEYSDAEGAYEALHATIRSKLTLDEYKALKAFGHSFKVTATVDPTCTEEGSITYTCEKSDASYTLTPTKYEEDLAAGNIYKELLETVAAAVTGLQPTGHGNYSEDESLAVAATCTEAGKRVFNCGNGECAHVVTVTDTTVFDDLHLSIQNILVDASAINNLKAITHDYVMGYTAPNCTEDGSYEFICKNNCGEATKTVQITTEHDDAYVATLYSEILEALPEGFKVADLNTTGHNYSEVSAEAKDATCTESGKRVFKCSNGECTDTVTVQYSSASNSYANLDATIKDELSENAYNDLAPNGHSFEETADKLDPTCTAEGYVVYDCTACDAAYTLIPSKYDENPGEVPAELVETVKAKADELRATGHKNTQDEPRKDATCQEDGYTAGTFCNDCGTWISGHEELTTGHVYNEDQNAITSKRTEPTCTTNGAWTYQCIWCDATNTVADTPESTLGHDEKSYGQQDATCTEVGYTAGVYCERCKIWLSGHEEIPAIGHKFSQSEQPRTCEEDGFITFDCDNCDLAYVVTPENFVEMKADANVDQQVKTALEGVNISDYAHIGHVWTITTEAAICGEEGSITFDCANCDAAYTITPTNYTTIVLPDDVKAKLDADYVIADYNALTHAYTSKIDPQPDCLNDGVETFTCQQPKDGGICGDTYTKPVPALGHTYMVDGALTGGTVTQFECEKEVITVYTCTREGCSDPTFTDVGDVLAHDIKHEVAEPATCVEDGEAARSWCQREGCTYEVGGGVISALGHDYKDGENWVEERCTTFVKPTCTEAGYKVYTCNREGCTENTEGHVSEQVPVAALGHDWSFVRTEPKCEEDGKIVYTCSRTDCVVKTYTLTPDTYVADQVPNGIEVTPELINGLKKTNHPNQYDVDETAPTCTEVGYTKGIYCPECQKYIDGGHREVEANGHTWTSQTTAPTCEAPGYISYSCTVDGCNGTYTVEYGIDLSTVVLPKNLTVTPAEVAALAQHKPASTTVAATCFANAYTEEYCSVEGEGKCDYYKKTEIPDTQREHDFKHTVVPPVCGDEMQNGYTLHECQYENCGYFYTDTPVIAKHTPGDETCTNPQVCTVCGNELKAAPGHNYVQTRTVAKTCTTDGQIIFTCQNTFCGSDTKVVTVTYSDDYAEIYEGLDEDIKLLLENAEAIANLKATDHAWDEGKVTTDPTCTEAGEKTYTCKNDSTHTKTEPVEATGHAYTLTNEQKATCLENGVLTYTCGNALCGDSTKVVTVTYSDDYAEIYEGLDEDIKLLLENAEAIANLKAIDHDWDEGKVTTDPTCTEAGVKTYTCKNDSTHTKTEPVEATGHAYTLTNEQKATCLENGVLTYTCGNALCGDATKVVTVTYSDDYAEIYEGLDEDIKLLLENAEAIANLKATDHDWDEGKVTTDPTCTEAGVKTYTCKNDANHTETETVAATGHAYEETEKQAATCLENGKIVFTCGNTLCGDATKVVEVSYSDNYAEVYEGLDEDIKLLLENAEAIANLKATDHAWDEGKVTTDPTCTEAGEKTYTCKNNSTHTKTETVEATGHAYTLTNEQKATCLENGVLTYTCGNALCGEATKVVTVTYSDNYAEVYEGLDEDIKLLLENAEAIANLKATDHAWDEGKVTTDPTCTEAGEKTYTCKNNSTHTKTETVAATGHAYKQTATTVKTCLEHGTITFTCQNEKCSNETKSVTVTYSEDYQNVYRALDKSIQTALRNALALRNLKATGHSYTETITPPTCTAQGYTTYDCKNCDYSYVDDYKDVIAHSYTSEVLKASTCKENGTIKYTCTVCGYSYEDTLPLDPVHKYVTMPDVKPTCTETGTKGGQQCSVCGKISDSNQPEIVPATGHTYGCEYTAPSCEGEGHYTFICQNGTCGDKLEITVATTADELAELLKKKEIAAAVQANSGEGFVPAEDLKALGHDIVIDEAQAPTCTEDGLKEGQHCSRCDAETIEQEIDPALGHKFSAEETGKDCIDGRICERCNQKIAATAEHEWNAGVITTDPTCTAEGVKTFTCEVCSDTYTEKVDKLSHSYEAVVTEPTCEADGFTTYTCSECGDTYTGNTVETTGHKWGEPVVTPNTCGKDGFTTKTCSACGKVETYDETTATGNHTYGDWVETKAPTCTEEGEKQHTCTVCGNVETGAVEVKDHLNDITIDAIAPECGKAGWTEGKKCSACGQTTVAPEVVKALQHNWVAFDYKAPTCTEDGNANNGSYCTLCGAVDAAATVLPATNHKNKAAGEAKDPTCTEAGNTAGVYCPDCDTWLEEQEELPATDHANKAAGEAKDPTCTEAGNTAGVYCPDCNTWLEEQEELPATDHANKAPGEAKNPTCTEAGNTAGVYCPDCDTWLEVQEVIDATGHTMDEGVEDPKHTCTTAGVMTYTCLNGCGYTETEEVLAAHTPEVIPAVPHTCTEDGLTEGSKCAVCGEILVAQEVDPAAHTWEDVTIHKEATCLEDGSKDVRCIAEGCGATDTIVIPAPGHTVVIDPAKAATCTVDGLTEGKHCSVCEEVLVAQQVIKAAHTWNVAPCTNVNAICIRCGATNGEELLPHNMAPATCTKPATCTYAGCGYTEGEALGHKLIDIDEIPVTCEESGWTAGVQCTVCGAYTTTPKEIPAFNHKNNDGTSAITTYPAKNPTFTSEGWYEYEACSRCTYSTKVTREKLPDPSIDTFEEFIKYLPKLEEWAVEYSRKTPGTDPVSLVIKYIRTGVDRYNSGSWGIMAGYEDKGFAEYVIQQEDAYNSQFTEEQQDQMLQVSGFKDMKEFYLPNNNFVDFGHMFGTMDITYTNKGSQNHADVGGWAGDLVDLLSTSDHESHQDLINSVGDDFEALVDIIRTDLLGYDFDHEDTFALNDIYGDLDAFYVMENLDADGYASGDMTALFNSYFDTSLSAVTRADYLLANRFDDVRTRSAIREAVYTEYTTNAMISTLEGTREFVNTDDLITRRKAVCYAFADYLCILAGDWVDDTDNPYLTDYESSYSLLAPGISMEIHKATSQDGKNMVYYLGYADLAREDVDVMINYHDRYVDEGWNMSRVLDQANKAADKYYANPESEHYIENFAPVVAVNGAGFDMGTGEPSGLLVMHGEEYHSINSNGFFGITKSGRAIIGTTDEYNSTYRGELAEGIAGFGTMLVKDGELWSGIPTTNYYSDRASRTAVGITATGRVVFMVLDGRQEPWSCGGSMIEIAQIMKLAGCVTAINMDGGGSTTFVARKAGDEELSLVNRPSDGVQRSVSTSMMMVSTAPSSKTFDRALVESNNNFMTVGAEVSVTSTGLSATNNIVALPEGAYWSVSDPEMAEIVDTGDVVINEDDPTVTKKTAKVIAKKNGEFEVYLMLDDVIIGQKTLNVIVPDQIYFTREKIDGIYGQGVELPLKARYEGKEAAFVPEDIVFTISNPAVGSMDGLTFNVAEESTVKTVTVTAALKLNAEATASINVVLYKDGENNFNFDNATGGNRELAWLREVSNAKQEGTSTYYIIDPKEDMVTSYTVALDMSQIPIPEKLESLTYMLPGSDLEGASAWTFLLQLAERISELTTVTAKFTLDPNFALVGYDEETGVYDASNLSLINDYFVLNKEAPVVYNPTDNTLTLKLNWKGFSQAIDPETANPMCIVSGLKLIPKDDAAWDAKDRLVAVHKAEVGYKVYMRANALHTFASKPENQATFDLYPYGPYTNSRGIVENGGWFSSTYATFNDTYTLVRSLKNGWVIEEGGFRYYIDGQYLKGIHQIADDGLFYQFDENGINIGQTPYTGLHKMDGYTYYMQNGTPYQGWITLDDGNWYLFTETKTPDETTGRGINGTHVVEFSGNRIVYEFDNGRLIDGVWYHDGIGWRYYYGPYYYKQGWRELTSQDGEKEMYFFEAYYVQDCTSPVQEAHAIVEYWYEFTDEGVLVGNAPTGLYWWDDDWYKGDAGTVDKELYYVVENLEGNGYSLAVTDGLHLIDGDYYYFDLWTGQAFRNKSAWISQTNDLLPEGTYRFADDGKIIMKTGVFNEDGTLYYYLNGKRTANAGMVEFEGNIYGVGSGAICYVSQSAYINKDNGLAAGEGTYRFDENGHLIVAKAVVNEDGTLYYYHDNGKRKANAGLVEFGGDIYYIGAYTAGGETINNNTAIAATDVEIYVASAKTNGLLKAGTYRFDENGKAILTTELVQGADGKLYYYLNGALQKDAGLIKYEGDYYYIDANGAAVTDTEMLVEKTIDPFPVDTYEFGSDGKMIIREGIYEGYYYVGGIKTAAGLVEEDGNYYYAAEGGKIVTDTKYDVQKTNDLLPAGTYRINEDGTVNLSTELADEDGTLVYYKDGLLTANAGLIEIDGDYYYIVENGVAVVDAKHKVTITNGLKPAGTYRFAEDGKMILTTELVEEADGKLYYYIDGRMADKADLIKYDGAYYWIEVNGFAVTNTKISLGTGELLPTGVYRVGADGKVILTTELVVENGNKVYYKNGILTTNAGLIEYEGDYYYIGAYVADGKTFNNNTAIAVVDAKVDVTTAKTNNLLPAGTYRFDEEGKAILTTEVALEDDGKYYYYVDGLLTKDAGLIEYEDAYYYITEDGTALTDAKVDVAGSDLLDDGTYRAGSDAKIILTTEIVKESDGKYYYYENGKLGKDAGLVAYNGYYYYITANGTAVTDDEMDVEKTNNLLPAGIYRFDAEGKADLATELVEGEDGKLYYYVNGALAEDAGLIEYEGAYYYITAEGTAVTGTEMLVEKTNNLFPVDTYEFGEDGKMVIREGIYEGYYYVGGVKTAAGLVQEGDDYYYAGEGGKLVTDAEIEVVKTNDLKPEGVYRFDEEGKMIQTTELVEKDGELYYYEDGKLGKDAGLILYEGDYYYIDENGTAVTDTKMLVEKTNDLLPEDTYCFGADGKMFERLPGDANDDQTVDLDDALLVLEYDSTEGVKINLLNADVNGDDLVDINDALLLMQYCSGWDVELI